MRTTLDLDEELVREAMRVSGCRTKTAAVTLGLESLVRAAARKRLAALGGGIPSAKTPRRRRPPARP